MKRSVILMTAAILTGTLASCGLFQTNTGDMPSKIGFSIPSNMYDSSRSITKATNSAGPAYLTLKVYVSAGKYAADLIDTVLSSVYQYKNLFMATAGNVFTSDDGKWFLFDSLGTSSYYLYYGNAVNTTNIYIDWEQKGDGLFAGKAVLFLNGEDPDINKALIYYDNSVTYPYLDIYVDPTAASEYAELHVRLEKVSDSEVKVQARTLTTNDAFPVGWDIVGYGKQDNYGGAVGYAIGATNFTVLSTPVTATNYVYKEQFDGTGATLWKLATCDMYTNGVVYLLDAVDNDHTDTNQAPVAAVTLELDGMTVLEASAYPTVVLP